MAKALKNDDVFDLLTNNAQTIEPKKPGKKSEKPRIDLNETEQQIFDAFCAADVIEKMAKGKQEAAKSAVIPMLRHKLLEKWMEQGKRTENPQIQTEKARANFIVREILKVQSTEGNEVQGLLKDAGFSQEMVEKIIGNEFKETVETNFCSLNKLRTGLPAEQKVVNKLLRLVLDNFTPEEQRILLFKEVKVEVSEGFLDRAVQYCPTLEMLQSLLEIIQPQWALSHMHYESNDLSSAVNNLTVELPVLENQKGEEEFFSPDNQWKAVANGKNAKLYENDSLVCDKECRSNEHARSTCKKWLRDEFYRTSSIQELSKK